MLHSMEDEARDRALSNSEERWLEEANKVACMFPGFGWPELMSFSEAVAEQLARFRGTTAIFADCRNGNHGECLRLWPINNRLWVCSCECHPATPVTTELIPPVGDK